MKSREQESNYKITYQMLNEETLFFFDGMVVLMMRDGKVERSGKLHFVNGRMYQHVLTESKEVDLHDSVLRCYNRYLSNLILGE